MARHNVPITEAKIPAELPEAPKQRQKGISLEQMIELRKKNLSHEQIAKIVGCSPANVTQRLKGMDIQDIELYKQNRADVFALLQQQIINSITPEDIKKTSASQRVTMAAILYDKERLERGQSTANIDNHSRIDVLTGKLEDIAKLQTRLSKHKVTRS